MAKLELKHPYNIFFGTMANQVRLDIMNAILAGPKNVTAIVESTGHKQPTVSKSLQRMERCGFVFCERRGKESIYTLNKTTIQPLLQLMNKHVGSFCCHLKENGDHA